MVIIGATVDEDEEEERVSTEGELLPPLLPLDDRASAGRLLLRLRGEDKEGPGELSLTEDADDAADDVGDEDEDAPGRRFDSEVDGAGGFGGCAAEEANENTADSRSSCEPVRR
jgi:hypothetical protein